MLSTSFLNFTPLQPFFLQNHITILIPSLSLPSALPLFSLHCENHIKKHHHPPPLALLLAFSPLSASSPLTPPPLFKSEDRHRNHNHYHNHPTQVHHGRVSSKPETKIKKEEKGQRIGTLFCPVFAGQIGGAHGMARDDEEREDCALAGGAAELR